MQYINLFLFGLLASVLGTLLPGLINMTVAKASIQEGRKRALLLGLGASIVVYLQAFIAVLFARFLDKRTDVSTLIQEVGIVIFFILGVFFFLKKPKNKVKREIGKRSSKLGYFLTGILLSLFNLFPIPFYVFISITLASYGYFSFEIAMITIFSLGASLGAMFVFYLYTLMFNSRNSNENGFLFKNINYILSFILIIVAVIGVVKLLNS